MALDKNGQSIQMGDRVKTQHGEHVVNGYANAWGSSGLQAIGHAKFVAFARDVEVVNPVGTSPGAPVTGAAANDQSIVWGNGQ